MPEGRERIFCPQCSRLTNITSADFQGRVAGFCRSCKVPVPVLALTLEGVPQDRLNCGCGRWVATGVVDRGWVQAYCATDRAVVRLQATKAPVIQTTREVQVPKRMRKLVREEQLIQLLQERWEAMRAERFQRRAELAVGLRFDVFNRDGFRCRYCGRGPEGGVTLEADHVTPRSAGGQDVLENLVTACWDCNRGKSAKRINALDAA